MKSSGNFIVLLICAGGFGMMLHIRAEAIASFLPEWYQTYGDTVFLGLSFVGLGLHIGSDAEKFFEHILRFFGLFGAPVIHYMILGDVTSFMTGQLVAVALLCFPVALMVDALVEKKKPKDQSQSRKAA